MKLYYYPGACSLADRIALAEAGIACDFEKVDLKTKMTAQGVSFLTINPKGYVPALLLDSGDLITENLAVLAWIADQAPHLAPAGPLGRVRLLEALAYISTELHKAFKPFFHTEAPDSARRMAAAEIVRRLELIAGRMNNEFILGDHFTVADAYLFVMLMWAKKFNLIAPQPFPTYFARLMTRMTVKDALAQEGLEQVLSARAPQAAMA